MTSDTTEGQGQTKAQTCEHTTTRSTVFANGKHATISLTCPFDVVPGSRFCERHQEAQS